jgi:hypothetical protein
VLALLLPVLANAQPVVGPEIRSATFQSVGPAVDAPTPALGLARNGAGFAITWAAINAAGRSRVIFATLNPEATTISARELPTLDASGDAYHSAIASRDKGFLVAWTEIAASEPQGVVAIAHLDTDGRLIRPPRELMPGLNAPTVYWTGADYFLGVGSTLWAISADDSNTRRIGVGETIDALSGTVSQVAIAGHSIQVSAGLCFHCPPKPPPQPPREIYVARFELVGTCSTTWSLEPAPPLGTGVGFNGRQYLVVWPDNNSTLKAFRLRGDCQNIDAPGSILIDHVFAGGSATSNPQVAWDGTRFLVVYQTSAGEIRGAAVDEGESAPPFVIANGNVRRPTLIAVAPGRFLVAYEALSVSGKQLAGRFIDFSPTRRRVAN